MGFDIQMILIVIFFVILISIQFTLNKILMELRVLKKSIQSKEKKYGENHELY